MATRPNSRSVSVSQGKGLEEEAAAASALMEAAEVAHAERIQKPTVYSSFASLRAHRRAVDPRCLPRLAGASFTRNSKFGWLEGLDLISRDPVFVPFDIVHTDYTSEPGGGFAQSSNGLASGNHPLEAIIAGLCETIERDATALWSARSIEDRAARRVRLKSVRDANCRSLLDRLDDCDMSVALWDATTDIGVACFICVITEKLGNQRSSLGAFRGAGCHLDRSVALLRAITEAAQARLTCIAGSRDDLPRSVHQRANGKALFGSLIDRWEQDQASRSFSDAPSLAADTMEDDLDLLLAKLRASAVGQVIVVDLTDPKIGIPVVRVIAPGLEFRDHGGLAEPGARVRAVRTKALQ